MGDQSLPHPSPTLEKMLPQLETTRDTKNTQYLGWGWRGSSRKTEGRRAGRAGRKRNWSRGNGSGLDQT